MTSELHPNRRPGVTGSQKHHEPGHRGPFRRAALILFLLTAWATGPLAGGLICLKEGIQGCDEYATVAHEYLPADTVSASEATVYINATEQGMYAHSNFVPVGSENPVKAIDSDGTPLWAIVDSMINVRSERGLRPGKIVIEQSAVPKGDDAMRLLGVCENVEVIGHDRQVRKVKLLESVDSAELYVQATPNNQCLWAEASNPQILAALNLVREKPLARTDMRVVSLVPDTTFQETIRSQGLADRCLGTNDTLSAKEVLGEGSGKYTVVIGHVEEGSARFSIGEKSVSVAELQAQAEASGQGVLFLGCEVAREGHGGSMDIVDTAQISAFLKDLKSCSTMEDMWKALDKAGIAIAVDEIGFPKPGKTSVKGRAFSKKAALAGSALGIVYILLDTDEEDVKKEAQPVAPLGPFKRAWGWVARMSQSQLGFVVLFVAGLGIVTGLGKVVGTIAEKRRR